MSESGKAPRSENLASFLLCAQPHIDCEKAERILAIAGSKPDWDSLWTAAREHNLAPVFCRNLEACAGDVLPPAWRQRFRDQFLNNCRRNLSLTAELFRLLHPLEAHGVSATPYKGPVLAAQAYGDVAMRQFSDLDILLPQRQIPAAHGALEESGFRPEIRGLIAANPGRQMPGQYAYRKDPDVLVELHTECTLRYFPRGLNLDELCERRELMNVAGQQILTFSPEDTLLLLSVHGSKHFWERLGWVAEMAALSWAQRELNWGIVMERARKWGIQRMVLMGAGLASRLFQMRLPKEVAACLAGDETAHRLIDGICDRFYAAKEIQLGVFSRFAFRVKMRGSLAHGLQYAVRLALTPTELERTPGKDYFEPLHALVRPLRLARTYGWRTRNGP